MNPAVVLAVFPVIFLGELPDKTMFASLVMATKGRPRQVWLGAAGAVVVHAAIATTVGVGLFHLLPHRAVDATVALLFLAGAAYAWLEGTREEEELIEHEAAAHTVVTTAFIVIFIAEWGDLTQILTANLAAHYHAALSVGVGAVLALWAVAGIAVAGGQGLLRRVNISCARSPPWCWSPWPLTRAGLLCGRGEAAWPLRAQGPQQPEPLSSPPVPQGRPVMGSSISAQPPMVTTTLPLALRSASSRMASPARSSG